VGSAEERRGDEPAWFYRAKVADIDTHAVQAFITDLSSRGKRETVGHVYNVLRSVLGLAARRRYIAANPCQDVALPKDSTTEERVFLTPRGGARAGRRHHAPLPGAGADGRRTRASGRAS
jgi:hypothetical protein